MNSKNKPHTSKAQRPSKAKSKRTTAVPAPPKASPTLGADAKKKSVRGKLPKMTIELEPDINGEYIYKITVRKIVKFKSEVGRKLRCTGPTFSPGSSCNNWDRFSYVPSMVRG